MDDDERVHHVLWTSGWDSTYRVCDLVLVHRRVVQPWYVIEPARRTARVELDRIRVLRRLIIAKDAAAAGLLRAPIVRHQQQIAPEPRHEAASAAVGAREPLTSQQSFLPRLVRQAGVGPMELGSTADDHMDRTLALVTVARNDADPPDDWWYVVPADSDPDAVTVWGGYRWPLLHVTKLQMAQAADRHGFRDVMERTWFCRWPTVLGRPCGFCSPCQVTREAGLLWRVPTASPWRRALHRGKDRARRRVAVLRADLTSVSARLSR